MKPQTHGPGWVSPAAALALRQALDQLIAEAEPCVLAMDDPRSYDATVQPMAAVAVVDLERIRDQYLLATPEKEWPSYLRDRDQLRIWRALSGMRYAAGIVPRREGLTVDDLLQCLDALSERLVEAADAAIAAENERREWQAALRGAGRVFRAMLDEGEAKP